MHCIDVHVPLERLCGEKKIELGIMHCGKRFLKYTLILFEYQLYASSPEPSVNVLQNTGNWKNIPLVVCQATESHHNLHKVWYTLKLNELPSFVLVADLKDSSLTTDIDMPVSHVVLRPLEEFFALTGRLLSAYRYYETHCACLLVNPSAMTFPRNNFCSLSFHITLLISTAYVLNNLFTICSN